METISDYLPERKVNIPCPECNEWYPHGGECDWCGYKTYELENENVRENDSSLLPLQFD